MSYNTEDYFSSNSFKELLNRFKEAEEKGQSIILDPEDYTDIAEYYYDKGDVKHAKEIIDFAVSIYPEVACVQAFKAKLALWVYDDIDEARDCAEQIEDKTDPEYFYLVGEIMLSEGQDDETDEYFEGCIDLVDEDDRDLFMIDIASIFADYNDIERAEAWLKRSEETDAPEYKEQLARIMLGKGEYTESEKMFNELIDKNPYNTRYWNSLATTQFSRNDTEEAIRSSEYSLAINPNDTTALYNKANGLFDLGNYSEAVAYYNRYTELCPDDDNAEIQTAFCYFMLENYAKSIVHFEKAEPLIDPYDQRLVKVYIVWSLCLLCLVRYDEAFEMLDRTKRLDCDHDEMLVYKAGILLGYDRPKEAKHCFIEAVRNTNGSPKILTKIATTLYEHERPVVAYHLFKKLYARFKDWTDGYAYYAACCYCLRRTDEFLENLAKAVKYTPTDAEYVFNKKFPEGMEPQEYVAYIKKELGRK